MYFLGACWKYSTVSWMVTPEKQQNYLASCCGSMTKLCYIYDVKEPYTPGEQIMRTIFDEIKKPDSYVCEILKYVLGHKNLCIYAKKNGKLVHNDNFYIVFSFVAYFAGPMSWIGSYFRIDTRDETMKILRKSGYDISSVPENFFNLYTINFKDEPIRILAQGVTISKDIPQL